MRPPPYPLDGGTCAKARLAKARLAKARLAKARLVPSRCVPSRCDKFNNNSLNMK